MKTKELLFASLMLSATLFARAEGLVYHCSFDSLDKITQPEVGPAGVAVDGTTLQSGHQGNALYVPAHKTAVNVQLQDGLPASKGCIEFWAKVLNASSSYSQACDPAFFVTGRIDNSEEVTSLQFNPNNGASGAGLCGMIGTYRVTTSSSFGSQPYSKFLNQGNWDDWHYYQILWNTNGLSDASTKSVSIRIDGSEKCSLAKGGINPITFVQQMSSPQNLGFATPSDATWKDRGYSPYLIDEFKIWDTDSPSIGDPQIQYTTAEYDGVYDEKGHGISISVTKPASSSISYAYDRNGPYQADVLTPTDIGQHRIWFVISADGYESVTNSATVTIRNPRFLHYYNSFDSLDKITQPEVGPTGVAVDGTTLQSGHQGNALYVPAHKTAVNVQLQDGLPASKGCIEFWAKVLNASSSYSQACDPAFFFTGRIDNSEEVTSLQFNPNNGAGGAGLCGMIGTYRVTTSSSFGSQPYSKFLNQGNWDDWHYYQILWNTNGLSDASTKSVSIRIDGSEKCSLAKGGINPITFVQQMSSPQNLGFATPSDATWKDRGYSPYLIDEFKIWNTEGNASLTLKQLSYSAQDCAASYDGKGHSITVDVADPTDAVIKYALSKDGPFSAQQLALTNACNATEIWYAIEAVGYASVTNKASVTISPASLIVTACSTNIVYGMPPVHCGVTYTGFVTGESTDALSGNLVYAYGSCVVGSPVGTYPIIPSGLTSANYAIMYENGLLTVEPAPIDPLCACDRAAPALSDFSDPEQVANSWPFSDFDFVGMYDGQLHSIATNAALQAYVCLLENHASVSYSDASNGVFSAAPSFTDVVATTLWYRVSAPNYQDLIHPIKIVITNRCLTVTSASESWTYDGLTHSNVTFSVSEPGFAPGEDLTVITAPSILNTGTIDNELGYAFAEGTEPRNYSIVYTSGSLTIDSAPIVPSQEDECPLPTDFNPSDTQQIANPNIVFSRFDYIGMYDGRPHTLETNVILQTYGTRLAHASVSYSDASNGVFSAAPSFTDVVATTLWYRVSAPNYQDLVHPIKIVITNRCLTVTSASESWTYDGLTHSNVTFSVSEPGFAPSEGLTVVSAAEIQDVGSIKNELIYAFIAGTKASNYDLAFAPGTLTISPAPVPEPQSITNKIQFRQSSITGVEGDLLELEIAGGSEEGEMSVDLYAQTETLSGASVIFNGQKCKLPLTLSWERGDLAPKPVFVSTRATSRIESDRFMTFQLANPVSGILGTPTICTVTVRDKITPAENTTPYVRALAWPANGGKVSGSGYLKSKSSTRTLKARALAGAHFNGWYRACADDPTCIDLSTCLSTAENYISGETGTFFAYFTDIKPCIVLPAPDFNSSDILGFSTDEQGGAVAPVGVKCVLPVRYTVASGDQSAKISVSKLPPGLKYNRKTGLIEGVPTKAGAYQIVVSGKNVSGKQTRTIPVSITAPLVLGKFEAVVFTSDAAEAGSVKLKFLKTGKLSASVRIGGKTVTFSGTGFFKEGNAFKIELVSRNKGNLALTVCRAEDSAEITGLVQINALADQSFHFVLHD